MRQMATRRLSNPGVFSTASGPSAFLGSYRFTPDPSRAASLTFAADGNPATLSVTDAASNVWTLSFPADSLLDSRTITKTPTASVDASGAVIPGSGAILVLPDGIQFDDAVTLTVTNPGALGTNASLMYAALDGSQLTFAATVETNNSYSTTLLHLAPRPWQTLRARTCRTFRRKCRPLKRSFNKRWTTRKPWPVEAPPPPPPDGYFCDLADAEAAADAYYTEAYARDMDVVGRLQTTAVALSRFGLNSYKEQAGIYIGVVFGNDVLPRTMALVGFYGSDPTKLAVVTSVALKVVNWARFIGFNQVDNLLASPSAALVNGGNSTLDQLISNHQYSAASSIFPLAKAIEQVSGVSPASLLARLPGALSFQLTIDVKATSQFAAYISTVSIAIEAQGTYPIVFAANALKGSGTCNYLSGVDTVTTQGLPAQITDMETGQSFAETSTLTIQDCPPTGPGMATLTFFQLGSPSETWNFPPPEGTQQEADLSGICEAVYSTTGNYNGAGFSFTLPLQDGNAQAINFPVVASTQLPDGGPAEMATLTITLTHTPQ